MTENDLRQVRRVVRSELSLGTILLGAILALVVTAVVLLLHGCTRTDTVATQSCDQAHPCRIRSAVARIRGDA